MQIAVIGAGQAEPQTRELARAVGRAIAEAGATLLTGGGGGVMRAACDGAHRAGGRTVAIHPDIGGGSERTEPYDVRLFTGLGQARNVILVLSADAVIAVGGEWGTLSEIALSVKHDKPVILLESWTLRRPDGSEPTELRRARDPIHAVRLAVERVRAAPA